MATFSAIPARKRPNGTPFDRRNFDVVEAPTEWLGGVRMVTIEQGHFGPARRRVTIVDAATVIAL